MSTKAAERKTGKTKKATAKTTLVAVVLDETGSMSPLQTDTIGSVNNYFKELAQVAPQARVSLMQFSWMFGHEENFRVEFSGIEVGKVPERTTENYRPRGNTPLYDAIGKAIRETEEQEADKVILVIVTDGYENASTEWTIEGVKKAIAEKEKTGKWTIVYLGANQDAFEAGRTLGVAGANTMTFTPTSGGVQNTSQSLARATGQTVNSGRGSTSSMFADAGQTRADYDDPSAPQAKDEPQEKGLWRPKKD